MRSARSAPDAIHTPGPNRAVPRLTSVGTPDPRRSGTASMARRASRRRPPCASNARKPSTRRSPLAGRSPLTISPKQNSAALSPGFCSVAAPGATLRLLLQLAGSPEQEPKRAAARLTTRPLVRDCGSVLRPGRGAGSPQKQARVSGRRSTVNSAKSLRPERRRMPARAAALVSAFWW